MQLLRTVSVAGLMLYALISPSISCQVIPYSAAQIQTISTQAPKNKSELDTWLRAPKSDDFKRDDQSLPLNANPVGTVSVLCHYKQHLVKNRSTESRGFN